MKDCEKSRLGHMTLKDSSRSKRGFASGEKKGCDLRDEIKEGSAGYNKETPYLSSEMR
jgi:hypothetical protein